MRRSRFTAFGAGLAIIVLVGSTVAALAATPGDGGVIRSGPSGKTTFASTNPAYSFQHPSSWKEKEGTSRGSVVLLVLRRVPAAAELVLRKVPSDTTLDVLGQTSKRRLTRQGFTILETYPATMGGQHALVIKYQTVEAMITFYYARFLTIHGRYAFGFTYYTADKYFDANYPAVASMAESFRFGRASRVTPDSVVPISLKGS